MTRGTRSWWLAAWLPVLLAAWVLNLPGCGAGTTGPAESEFRQTASGLRYRIRRQGTGPVPTLEQFVRIHYRGWLDNGSVFDSTYERGEPAALQLKQAIPGWQEGLLLIREGGAIELEVPPELAYGAEGRPMIPPDSRLHFLVEIVEVVRHR